MSAPGWAAESNDGSAPFVGPLPLVLSAAADREPAPNAISAFVRRIFEDSRGNLWLGTNGDGVARYDGTELTYHSVDEGFGGEAVRGIVEDREGAVWFATSGGVSRFDGTSFATFTTADGLPHDDVWSILLTREGTLWAGTLGGVCRFDGERFLPFPLPPAEPDYRRGVVGPNIVRCITEDRAGNLWFATGGGAFRYDGRSLTRFSEEEGLCHDSVNCILEDRKGRVWFATHYRGVCRYEGGTFRQIFGATQGGVESETEAWDLFEDDAGNIWFPVERAGLYRYDGRTFTTFAHERGLESPAIQCTYQDRRGRIWAGGYLGLYRLEGDDFIAVTRDGPW